VRAIALILLLAAVSGCRAPNGQKLDYLTVNRESYDFFKESMAGDYQRSKAELKRDLTFSSRAPLNRRLRKEGIAFTWHSAWVGTWSNTRDSLRMFAREFSGKSTSLRNGLFGFLDTGSAKQNSRYP